MGAPQPPPLFAEFIGVDGFGLHGTMALHRALEIGVIVRVVRQRYVAHARAGVQEIDHLRAVFKVGVELVLGHFLLGDELAQIGFGLGR